MNVYGYSARTWYGTVFFDIIATSQVDADAALERECSVEPDGPPASYFSWNSVSELSSPATFTLGPSKNADCFEREVVLQLQLLKNAVLEWADSPNVSDRTDTPEARLALAVETYKAACGTDLSDFSSVELGRTDPNAEHLFAKVRYGPRERLGLPPEEK